MRDKPCSSGRCGGGAHPFSRRRAPRQPCGGVLCFRGVLCSDGSALCGALVVHPRFRHTLDDPPVPADPPCPADWLDLPPEVAEMIAAHLDTAQDLLRLGAACRATRQLAMSDVLWQRLCRQRFGAPEEAPEGVGPPSPSFWLHLYKYNHCIFLDLVRRSGPSGFGPRVASGPLIIQLN